MAKQNLTKRIDDVGRARSLNDTTQNNDDVCEWVGDVVDATLSELEQNCDTIEAGGNVVDVDEWAARDFPGQDSIGKVVRDLETSCWRLCIGPNVRVVRCLIVRANENGNGVPLCTIPLPLRDSRSARVGRETLVEGGRSREKESGHIVLYCVEWFYPFAKQKKGRLAPPRGN